MNSTLMIIFGVGHTVLGLGVFGLVAWLMLGEKGDEAEGTDDGGGGGGGGLRPRPWRPRPGRPRMRRGPKRVPETGGPRPARALIRR